jgi:hypothetical protein
MFVVTSVERGTPMHLFSSLNVRSGSVRAFSVGAVLVVAAALCAPADAAGAHRSALDRSAAPKAATLHAKLKGSNEVPGPGDPNGTGSVTITLKPAVGKVCADATWSRIGTPLAAHIHKGVAGVSGDVVVDLTGAVTGGAHCAALGKAKIHRIAEHPRRFYFNIHTEAYQAGAIRGQLHR